MSGPRREREILAQLPPGTTGRSTWWDHLGRFLGHPSLLLLWAVAAGMLLLVALLR